MEIKNIKLRKISSIYIVAFLIFYSLSHSIAEATEFKEIGLIKKNDCKAILPDISGITYRFGGKCSEKQASGVGKVEALKEGRIFFTTEVNFKEGKIFSATPIKFVDGTLVIVEINAGKWKTGVKIVPGNYEYNGDLDGFTEHGTGSIKFLDGTKYSGEFINGTRSGKGYFSGKDFEYTGEFLNDKFNGKGKFNGAYFQKNVSYDGDFTNSIFGPKGRLIDDDIYDGEFKNGVPSGYGIYTFSKSLDKFDGQVKTKITEKNGKLNYEIVFHGAGIYTSKDGNYKLSGTWTNDRKIGNFTGRVGRVNIDALFMNDKPIYGKLEQIGEFTYNGEINGENWKPGGMGELTMTNPSHKTNGSRTIGKFVDWLKCVGQCFIYFNNGIIASVQNDQNGIAVPGTLLRIDDGAEKFYGARKNVENNFSVAAKIIRDQLDAFKDVDTSPQSLNQSHPVTVIDSSGQIIGSGSMWSTHQPGMIGGGNFIKISK